MKNVLKIMILILLVFQISCGVVSEEYTVKYISDGDTITVTNNKTNKKVKVRLFGNRCTRKDSRIWIREQRIFNEFNKR